MKCKADALSELVDYGRAQGLEWWTNEQIYKWEISRRSVEVTFDSDNTLTLRAEKPLRESTLLFLNAHQESGSIKINDQPAQSERRSLYSFEFDAVTVDLAGEVRVRVT